MGVSGCGKSTVGKALSEKLRRPFKDGDTFHSPENVEKMKAGTPLNDSDRLPWLQAINNYARLNQGYVIACSALKRRYRSILCEHLPNGASGRAVFILLNLKRQVMFSAQKNVVKEMGRKVKMDNKQLKFALASVRSFSHFHTFSRIHRFIFCREVLQQRVNSRPGHFMPSTLLDSQLATLELPSPDESNIVTVDANSENVDQIVDTIVKTLALICE